jgi:hypothetical protein
MTVVPETDAGSIIVLTGQDLGADGGCSTLSIEFHSYSYNSAFILTGNRQKAMIRLLQ